MTDPAECPVSSAILELYVKLSNALQAWTCQGLGWRAEEHEERIVLCAQAVRLSTMLKRIASALAAKDDEAAEIFCRCALETIINFHYIKAPADPTEKTQRLDLFKQDANRPAHRIKTFLDKKATLSEHDRYIQQGLDEALEGESRKLPPINKRIKCIKESSSLKPEDGNAFDVLSASIHGTHWNLVAFHVKETQDGSWVPNYSPVSNLPSEMLEGIGMHAIGVLAHWCQLVHPRMQDQWGKVLEDLGRDLRTLHEMTASNPPR